jgi:RND family efflux transporter MFP subunit
MPNHALATPVAIALALALTGCADHDKPATPPPAPASVQAQVSVIQTVERQASIAAPGTLIALESVKVASRLMGYIKDIAVEEGQSVKAGQRLFSIDPLDIEGAVDQARLGLQQAEDAMQDAKADYDRFATLHKEEVVSRQQYEKMKLNYEIAVSRAAQAKAGLGTAQGQMKYATVASPIDGVVTQKLANAGDIAAPGHPVLMLENPSRLQVLTSVTREVYQGLKLGMAVPVEVDGHAGPLTARVARLPAYADPVSHTYPVKLDINAPGLQSGAFARVLFPVGKRSMLAVPKAALLERAGIAGVFVVDAQGLAQYRMVRTGTEVDGQVEILSGINPGDKVVTGNAAAVNNGNKIQG